MDYNCQYVWLMIMMMMSTKKAKGQICRFIHLLQLDTIYTLPRPDALPEKLMAFETAGPHKSHPWVRQMCSLSFKNGRYCSRKSKKWPINSPLPDDKKRKAMSENPLLQTLNLGRYLNNNYNDISLLVYQLESTFYYIHILCSNNNICASAKLSVNSLNFTLKIF